MATVTSREERDRNELAVGVEASHVGHGDRLHGIEVTIEPGAAVETHDHPHEQITYVVRGEIVLTIDGDDHHIGEGSAAHLPGDTPHAVRNESNERAIITDTFSPPREDLLE